MSSNNIFRKKSLDVLLAEMAGEHRLHRVLGPVALTSLGIGSIIGAGIFVMTGQAAAEAAGPAIVLSFMVAALGCTFAALCYAEFAAMAPVAGSAYTYSYTTLGEIFAWIIGWDLILEYSMACATVASAWPKYLNELLGAIGWPQIDARWVFPPIQVSAEDPVGIFNVPAVLIMGLITVILVLGIRESANVNALLVLVKLAVVILVIVVGCTFIDPSNWFDIDVGARKVMDDPAKNWGILGMMGVNQWLLPLDDSVRNSFAPYGLSGIMAGAAAVFFAYIGFDSISTHAEEAVRPQRDVPFGILASLIICTILYIGVAAVITGMVPYPQIDTHAAVAAAFRQKAEAETNPNLILRWSNGLVAAGGLAGMTSVLLVTFLSQVRIFLAMARDGLLPPIFQQVHEKYRTPHLATMLTGAVICLAAGLLPQRVLGEMVNIGTLLAFVIVCASVLVLRRQRPDAERPFRCPAIWFVGPAGIAVNFAMMLFQHWDTWLRLVGWLAIGMVIYFAYGRRHSVLGKEVWRQLKEQGVGPTDAPLDTVKR